MTIGRTTFRQAWDVPVRLGLLEEDADTFEQAIKNLATKEQIEGLRTTMRWMIATFTTMALSIIGALAVLAFR